MTDLVYVLERDHDGERIEIPESPLKVSVGRGRQNNFVTMSHSAGEEHFAVFRRGDKCFLRDLGFGTSTNNGLVSGETVEILPGEQMIFREGGNVLYKLKAYTKLQQGI